MNIKAKIVAIIVNILSKINLLSIAIGFINAGIAITNNILNILVLNLIFLFELKNDC